VKKGGTVTSAQRVELITVAAAVSAQGTFIHPMLLFSRKNFRDHFIRGPAGCTGASTGSGWMNEEPFVLLNQHLHAIQNLAEMILFVSLFLDNHSSHLSCLAFDICKENGVILLSFPPHCSHSLQPLDISSFGPFKNTCSRSLNYWFKSHPGKTNDVWFARNHATLNTFTPSNVTPGSKSAGMFPFNADKFQHVDFASSFVTDRLTEEENNNNAEGICAPIPGPQHRGNSLEPINASFSSEYVRPFPKASLRKVPNRGKEMKSSCLDRHFWKTSHRRRREEQESDSAEKTAIRPRKRTKRQQNFLKGRQTKAATNLGVLVCGARYKAGEDWVQYNEMWTVVTFCLFRMRHLLRIHRLPRWLRLSVATWPAVCCNLPQERGSF
jgi:hypothetical protein